MGRGTRTVPAVVSQVANEDAATVVRRVAVTAGLVAATRWRPWCLEGQWALAGARALAQELRLKVLLIDRR
jgi:hypothetical protein